MFSLVVWASCLCQAANLIIKKPLAEEHVCPLPGSRWEVAWIMQISALLFLHLYQVRSMNAHGAFSDAQGP